MKSKMTVTDHEPSRLSAALRAVLLGVPFALGSSVGLTQEVIEIDAPDTPSLTLFPDDYPNGATVNVRSTGSLGELLIAPFANPADLTNPPPFEVNVEGSIGSAIFDTANFDINPFVPLSALNISQSGVVSNMALNGGAVVNNDGVIAMAPSDSSLGGTTILLSSPFDGVSGAVSAYTINNRGSISVTGENFSGGIFGNAIVAYGGDGVVPGTVSLRLDNSGTISFGPDTTGALVRWREADEIVIVNSGTMDVGFTAVAGGINLDPLIFLRDGAQTAGLVFDDQMTITNAAGGELIGARVFLASPFDGSENYRLSFTNEGSIRASGSDNLSPTSPGGAAFELGGLSTFVNSGRIEIDGTLLDGGNGSGEFLDQFVEFGAVPEQSDFDSQTIDFLNTASGVIDATGEGIEFQSGSIVNEGTIIARDEQNGFGVVAVVPSLVNTPQDDWNDSVEVVNRGVIQAGLVGVSKLFGVVNMNLTNSGTIEILQPTAFNPTAIEIFDGTMSISNEASGVIRGPYAIRGSGTSLNVVNAGLMDGLISFDGVTTLENSGSIIGDVTLGAGNDTVTSDGLFDGSVFLGDGDDTFVARGGLTVTGSVQGGNGFDTLRLVNGSFTPGEGAIQGLFDEFDAAFLEGSFSLAGDNIGTETVLTAPVLTFEPGTTFIVDAREDGTGDLLRNTGTIALNGGQVQALSNDGSWSVSRDYTILTADSGLTGTFDGATSNLTYLDASLSYTANSVILSLERVDGLIQGDILETTNAQQLSVAARVVPRIIQTQVSNSIAKLLGSGAAASSVVAAPISIATGLSAGDETDPDTGATGSAWLNLTPTRYDQRAVLPGAEGLQEIDGDTLNLLAGVDRLVGSRFVVGGFVGYEDSEVDYRAIRGMQESDGYLLGAYAGVAFNSWLYSSVYVNWAQLDNLLEERAFDTPDVQKASYDSERLSVGVDLTATMRRGNMNYLAQAAYNYSDESYDRYTTNRGDLVQLEDLSLGRFSLTGEVSYSGEQWNPYLSMSYEIDAEVSDTVEDDNGLVVNAGLRAQRGERLAFEAYIATVTSRNNENQELFGVNINYAF